MKTLLFWVAVWVVSACVALLWMAVVPLAVGPLSTILVGFVIGASFLGGMRLVAVFA